MANHAKSSAVELIKNSSTYFDHAKRDFSKRDVIGYFFGDFGCNMSCSLISSFMFIFFTQFVGIKLVHYSLIILVTKIFDGINDPIVGSLIDRYTPAKGDKFKPWIKYGGMILAFASVIMFIDSSDWNYPLKLAICIGSYIIWDICYTVVNVPYGSLLSVMTVKAKERTVLSTARSYGYLIGNSLVGFIVPIFVYQNIKVNGEVQNVFLGERIFWVAVVLGCVAVFSFIFLLRNVEERVMHKAEKGQAKENFSYLEALKGFIKNKATLTLTLAGVVQMIFIASSVQLGTITFQLYFKNGALSSFLTLTQIVPLIFGTILGPVLIDKIGKKASVAIPALATALIYFALVFLPIQSPFVWIALQIIAVTISCVSKVAIWAMVSDAIDYQELQTGKRNEGSIYATYSMARKIGQGIGQALIPASIALLIPGLDLAEATTWLPEYANSVKALSVLFPAVGWFLMFVFFKLYPIGKKEEIELQKAIAS